MTKKLSVNGNLFSMGNEVNKPEEKTESKQSENKTKSVSKESTSVTKIVSKKESNNVIKNELTIARKKVTDYTIPMTYRLRAETIEKIRRQARKAEMGVAEYLQTVLDLVLDKIEIE